MFKIGYKVYGGSARYVLVGLFFGGSTGRDVDNPKAVNDLMTYLTQS
ncbi:hypothetical protein [Paenibacillus sp. 2KB_22]